MTTRYVPILISNDARRAGWYVQDVGRSTPHAVVVVGDRHDTMTAAQIAADALGRVS